MNPDAIETIRSAPSPAAFRFERTLELSEADFARLAGDAPKPPTWRGRLRLLGLIALGVALLFFRWTAAVGGLLLLFAGVVLATPRITRWSQRKHYRDNTYLHGPTLHGVSDRGIWFQGGTLRSESTWEGVRVWDRRDGYLMLGASGVPAVYLPEAELRASGLDERVLELARRHATRFDSPSADGRMPQTDAT